MRYIVEPIVCDYEIIDTKTTESVCMLNSQANARAIACILNLDDKEEILHPKTQNALRDIFEQIFTGKQIEGSETEC